MANKRSPGGPKPYKPFRLAHDVVAIIESEAANYGSQTAVVEAAVRALRADKRAEKEPDPYPDRA